MMYGPRGAYDSQTLEEMDRRVEDADFVRRLLRALDDERVASAIRALLREKKAKKGMKWKEEDKEA